AAVTDPAERECPAPGGNRDSSPVAGALTHTATGLPWLAPAAASLTLLAREPATAWPTVRHDPGALLLLLRSQSSFEPHLPFPEGLLAGPAPLERALRLLEQPIGHVDWHEPRVRPVYEGCLILARLARGLAQRSG